MTGGPYALFLIWPTDEFQVMFRRWAWEPHPEYPHINQSVHDTGAVVGRVVHLNTTDQGSGRDPTPAQRLDPAWPKSHEGHVFTDDDAWQIREDRLWTSDGTDRFIHAQAPVGACFEAPAWMDWYNSVQSEIYKAVAGQRPMYWIRIPDGSPNGGHWFTPDRIASNGPGWHVTGTLPGVSVSPSVHHLPGDPQGWHGWVGVNGTPVGHLSRDLDGRPR